MHLLLLLLMLAQAVPPVLSQTYEKFVMQHTYNGTGLMDCTQDLNEILKTINKDCRPCNTFILGEDSYRTNMTAVNEVCSSVGGVYVGKTFVGDDLYMSKDSFRAAYCKRDREKSGAQPPDCVYRTVEEKDIRSKRIIVACRKSLPIRLYPCTSQTFMKV